MKSNNLHGFLIAGIFVLLGILIINSFLVFSVERSLNAKIDEARELARPAKIEIIKLESSCSDCFDINIVVDALKESGFNLNIIGEKSLAGNSQEAAKLIKKYNIEKLPNLILRGEINKTPIPNFRQADDALVFDSIAPPYENAATKKIMGKVSAIIINDSACKVCTNFNLVIQSLKQNGVFIGEEELLYSSETKAKELIGKFAIKKLPVVFLSNDIDAYPSIAQSIIQLKSKDGAYYVMESQAPYMEADTGKFRGLAKLTLLNDSSCKECYDIGIHKPILARFGIAIDKEINVDVSSAEGKQLISKYNIKNVPTIILTGDLDVYETLKSVWSQVGTVETDGAYVFREISAMGPTMVYKDITTNEVKKVEPPQQASAQQ